MIALRRYFLSFFLTLVNQKRYPTGLYGNELEEHFAVSILGNVSNLTDAIGDDVSAELVEPPEDDVTITLEPPLPEEAVIVRPIPTLDSSRPRSSADALPPKPTSGNNGSLSYSAQVAEQFLRLIISRLASNEGARMPPASLSSKWGPGSESGGWHSIWRLVSRRRGEASLTVGNER